MYGRAVVLRWPLRGHPRVTVMDGTPLRSNTITHLTASVRRIGPGRNQQRYVIMAFRLGHRKAHRHDVQKSRRGERHLLARKIIADGKTKLIGSDRHRPLVY